MAAKPGQVIDRTGMIPVEFDEDVSANYVVEYSAAQKVQKVSTDGNLPAGVTEQDWTDGDWGEIITKGRVRCIVHTGETVTQNDLLMGADDGTVLAATSAAPLVGRALTGGTAGQYVMVELMIGSHEPA
jgi:hypothetical protein